MKVAILLACSCAILIHQRVACAAIKAPLDIISLDDLTESERKHLEFLESHYHEPRPKRSGDDLLSSLKATIGQGIKSKLSLIGKGSASASAHFSGGSSGGHGYHHYDVPETYDHKSFDFWTLKKSILNTLLQAVKAIKGGVLAIKGQLIKGSGYLVSAKGKLISAKGEAITTLGKNIAASAVLSPYPYHHGHSTGHADHGSPHVHYHHSGPSGEYGSPSAPGPEYEVPQHHYHAPHHEDKPDAEQAGILILKKIPKHHDHHEYHHHEHDDDHHHHEHDDDHKVPDFKPIEHTGPGLGTIIGKFFTASTSLKADEPAPFGNTAPAHSSHHEEHYDHHAHPSHSLSHHEEELHDPRSHSNTHSSSHDEVHHDPHPTHESHHNQYQSDSLKPPATNYGSPFEDAPDFLNIAEYTSESKNNQQTASDALKTPAVSSLPAKEPEKPQFQASGPQSYDEIRPLSSFTNAGFDSAGLTNLYPEKTKLFEGSLSNKPNENFPPYSDGQAIKQMPYDFGAFQTSGVGNDGGLKYLSPPVQQPQVFPSGLGAYASFPSKSAAFKPHGFHDSVPSYAQKVPRVHKRPPRGPPMSRLKKPPTYDVVKSISYQLGPNGPKRL